MFQIPNYNPPPNDLSGPRMLTRNSFHFIPPRTPDPMLSALILATVLGQTKVAFRELKVGDVIELGQAPVLPSPQSPPAKPHAILVTQSIPVADPYGFLAWLNGHRARNGRLPVTCDANLSAWAAANNTQQHSRGMGHHIFGPARRQNAGMGHGSTVWQTWVASPAHNAALLDPTITVIGIACSGSYWTFNGR